MTRVLIGIALIALGLYLFANNIGGSYVGIVAATPITLGIFVIRGRLSTG